MEFKATQTDVNIDGKCLHWEADLDSLDGNNCKSKAVALTYKLEQQKSHIQESLNLLTCAGSSTNTKNQLI